MDILRKSITSFSFADIVSFCQQNEREGIQLEYKRDLTTSSIPKSIAAFSNTRGGVIIIGVDENRAGLPSAWNGVVINGQNVERIHQWASNIDPLPHYDVYVTDEQNGNVFILIRVFEGDNTPYYVHNDAHLWVRTGNVSTLIDIALPETQALLYQKRENARLARSNYISLSKKIWKSSLAKAEYERKTIIGNALAKGDGSAKGIPTMELGLLKERLNVYIQPFFPHTPLVKPSEIQAKLNDIRFTGSAYNEFPPLNMDSIPEGLVSFEWDHSDGRLYCQQIYATGFLQNIEEISNETLIGGTKLYIQNIAAKIFIVLKSAEKFYKLFGYQGNLVGAAILENLSTFTELLPITIQGSLSSHHSLIKRTGLLSEYKWNLELDTAILSNPSKLQEYFIEVVKDIYWQLGFGDVNESVVKSFLNDNKWLV
jgi:hypothetical protein